MERSKKEHGRGLASDFASAVSSLAEGGLTFRQPFDLSSSAALAANLDSGDGAQHLFDVTAQRDCQYEVQIRARLKDHPDVDEREVLNTSVPSTRLLISLLEDLVDELHARMEE